MLSTPRAHGGTCVLLCVVRGAKVADLMNSRLASFSGYAGVACKQRETKAGSLFLMWIEPEKFSVRLGVGLWLIDSGDFGPACRRSNCMYTVFLVTPCAR